MTRLQRSSIDHCANLISAARTFAGIVRFVGSDLPRFFTTYCNTQERNALDLEARFKALDLDADDRTFVTRRLNRARRDIARLRIFNRANDGRTNTHLAACAAGCIEANLRTLTGICDRTTAAAPTSLHLAHAA